MAKRGSKTLMDMGSVAAMPMSREQKQREARYAAESDLRALTSAEVTTLSISGPSANKAWT